MIEWVMLSNAYLLVRDNNCFVLIFVLIYMSDIVCWRWSSRIFHQVKDLNDPGDNKQYQRLFKRTRLLLFAFIFKTILSSKMNKFVISAKFNSISRLCKMSFKYDNMSSQLRPMFNFFVSFWTNQIIWQDKNCRNFCRRTNFQCHCVSEQPEMKKIVPLFFCCKYKILFISDDIYSKVSFRLYQKIVTWK